jgi:hypothetical protein
MQSATQKKHRLDGRGYRSYPLIGGKRKKRMQEWQNKKSKIIESRPLVANDFASFVESEDEALAACDIGSTVIAFIFTYI